MSCFFVNGNILCFVFDDSIMELDIAHEGELKVHYSDSLVTLMRQVRQLKEFGYSIPEPIVIAWTNAEKFYRYALKLKQIANFYNTMSDQIIQSQKVCLSMFCQTYCVFKWKRWIDCMLL